MTNRVLIVDDDGNFRKIVEKRLRSFMKDAHVTHLDSLATAREFLKLNDGYTFDLVVLDQNLPDGRGVDLLNEGVFRDLAVLSVSSDDAPEIPGLTLKAGAAYFLNKKRIGEPLVEPLVRGIIDRNRIQKEYEAVRLQAKMTETVKTLVGTLRHEINNPLGAVLGAAYILRTDKGATDDQRHAAQLVEQSGQRIKHVLDELCNAMELDPVQKGGELVFQVPGDKPWGKK